MALAINSDPDSPNVLVLDPVSPTSWQGHFPAVVVWLVWLEARFVYSRTVDGGLSGSEVASDWVKF